MGYPMKTSIEILADEINRADKARKLKAELTAELAGFRRYIGKAYPNLSASALDTKAQTYINDFKELLKDIPDEF